MAHLRASEKYGRATDGTCPYRRLIRAPILSVAVHSSDRGVLTRSPGADLTALGTRGARPEQTGLAAAWVREKGGRRSCRSRGARVPVVQPAEVRPRHDGTRSVFDRTRLGCIPVEPEARAGAPSGRPSGAPVGGHG